MQSPTPLKILGSEYREGRYYYIRFVDQPAGEWGIALCTKTRKFLELGFQTARGLVNWDNPHLQVIGMVPNPPLPPPSSPFRRGLLSEKGVA